MNVIPQNFQMDFINPQPIRKLYFELGKALYRQGQPQKAIEHLMDALSIADGSVEDWKIYNELYDICRQTNQPELAKENLLKVIATAPPYISDEMIRNKNMDFIEIEIESDEKEKEAVLLLQGKAEILKNEGNAAEAAQVFDEALKAAAQVEDKDVEKAVLLDIAELHIDENQLKKASDILHAFGTLQNPELKKRWQVLNAKFHLQMQNLDTAISLCDEVISEHPNCLQAAIIKLQTFIVSRRYKEALAQVHQLMSTHSVSADLIFYKVEILLEGHISIDEGLQLLQQLKEQNGISFIKRKINEPHIRFRPQHGNDNYFLALVYKTFLADFGIEAALEQTDLALSENVEFEGYTYPYGIIYELKASLKQMQQQVEEAARLYYLAGKEYYWNAFYPQANTMFAKSYTLEKQNNFSAPLIDNYWYYAECLVQQSYTQTDPFVDEVLVKNAAAIWYEAYALQKPSFNDAWAYLTATLIHEQLSKLPEREKQQELFFCWFYAEHNILIDNTNPKAWGFISRAFSSNILDRNAASLAQKAYQLDSKDPFIWEERAISLLNNGNWPEAETFLQKLIEYKPAETVFKAYKGLALYHLEQYKEAQVLLNDVVAGRPDWLWARNLRLIINWMLHDAEAIKIDAEWIWDKRDQPAYKNTTTHEFAYAAYFLGLEEEALKLFTIAPDDNSNEIISSLFFYTLFYALKNNEPELQTHLKKYIKASRHVYNFTELQNAFAALLPQRKDLQQQLEDGMNNFKRQEPSLVTELHQFADVCTGCKNWGSVGWEAIQLSFFRLALEQGDWKTAFDCSMQFQMVQTTRVDKYHLWNRLFIALKEFFLNNPKAFLQQEVRRAMQAYADDSPFSNLESLGDLYLILSITGREQTFLSDELKSVALQMYEHAGIANGSDKEEAWMKICAELLPELQLQPSEISKAETMRVLKCLNCGAEVMGRSQKYCFSCGQRLA